MPSRLYRAASTFALLIVVAGCGDDLPHPVAATPATTAPSSAMPDRSFTAPDSPAAVTLEDYRGMWAAAANGLPCTGAGSTGGPYRIEAGPGPLWVWSGQSRSNEPQIFDKTELIDGRLVATELYVRETSCGGIDGDIRVELDCVAGRIGIYVADKLTGTGALRRTDRPAGGSCKY